MYMFTILVTRLSDGARLRLRASNLSELIQALSSLSGFSGVDKSCIRVYTFRSKSR